MTDNPHTQSFPTTGHEEDLFIEQGELGEQHLLHFQNILKTILTSFMESNGLTSDLPEENILAIAKRHLKRFYEKGSIVLREELDIAGHHIQMMDIQKAEVIIYSITKNKPKKTELKLSV